MVKTLCIIRGIPGSGKTTKAIELKKSIYPDSVIFEADQFFEKEGSYNFDASKLHYAHIECKQNTETSLINNIKTVIVSNTFTTLKELKPYFELAKQYNYCIVVYELPHAPVIEGTQKNIHNVPEETISRMLKRWQNIPFSVVSDFCIKILSL